MGTKAVLCSCGKPFKADSALRQHQRDSPRYVDATQAPELTLCLDKEAGQGFIPFSVGGPTTSFVQNPDIRIPSWSEAAAPSLLREQATAGKKNVSSGEGTKTKKKEKKGRGHILKMDQGGDSSGQANANTGQMMDSFEDQDWALCDGDCGWCGHCAKGVLY